MILSSVTYNIFNNESFVCRNARSEWGRFFSLRKIYMSIMAYNPYN